MASIGNNIAIQIAAGSSLKVNIRSSSVFESCDEIINIIITFCFHQQAVYKHYDPNGSLTLQHFIIFFGAFELLLSQFPDIHSLRWLNALCTLSTIGFASTAIGVTIYSGSLESYYSLIAFHAPLSIWVVARMIAGKRADRSLITYSLQGSSSDKVFRLFNALGAIAFSFGDAMLPEIQVSSPALCFCFMQHSIVWVLNQTHRLLLEHGEEAG